MNRFSALPYIFFPFHSGKPDDRSSILSSSKKPLQTDKYNLKYNQNRNRFEQELLGKSGAAAKASKSFNLLDVMGSMKKDKKSSYEDIRAKLSAQAKASLAGVMAALLMGKKQ